MKELINEIINNNFVECDAKDGTFIINGKWYAPKWGCDTIQELLEDIKAMKLKHIDEKIEMLVRFVGILPLGHASIHKYDKQIKDLQNQKFILEKQLKNLTK